MNRSAPAARTDRGRRAPRHDVWPRAARSALRYPAVPDPQQCRRTAADQTIDVAVGGFDRLALRAPGRPPRFRASAPAPRERPSRSARRAPASRPLAREDQWIAPAPRARRRPSSSARRTRPAHRITWRPHPGFRAAGRAAGSGCASRRFPEAFAHHGLGLQHRAIAGAGPPGQRRRLTVLDDASLAHDEHAIERERLADIVRDAEQVAPCHSGGIARAGRAGARARARETARRESRAAHPAATSARARRTRCPSPPEIDPPPSPSGVCSPSGSRSSTSRRSAASMRSRRATRSRRGPSHIAGCRAATGSTAEQRDPPRLSRPASGPASVHRASRRRPAHGRRGPMPSEQQSDEARLPCAGCTDNRDVAAARDGKAQVVKNRVTRRPNAHIVEDDGDSRSRFGHGGW